VSYKIYKFPVDITGTQTLMLPNGSEFLTFQVQNEKPFVWVKFNTECEYRLEPRVLMVVGTGHEFNLATPSDKYIGTIQQPPFVWHLFERVQHENSIS
jgi:hypothetical protein